MSEQTEFFNGIFSHLEAMPFASGYSHPCEKDIEEYLDKHKSLFFKQIFDYADERNSYLLAEMLHCLNHLDNLIFHKNDIYFLSEKLLASEFFVLRDAAITLLETVRGTKALEILKSHQENVFYIKRYQETVISELESEKDKS